MPTMTMTRRQQHQARRRKGASSTRAMMMMMSATILLLVEQPAAAFSVSPLATAAFSVHSSNHKNPRLTAAARSNLFTSRPSRIVSRPSQSSSFSSSLMSALSMSSNSNSPSSSNANNANNTVSPLLQELSKLLQRTSWFSWWAQTILTVISCTILLFAANAKSSVTSGPNFFLSGLGLTVSVLSIVWTWGNGARLSRRLLRNKPSNGNNNAIGNALGRNNNNNNNGNNNNNFFQPASPNDLLRRAIRVQCSLNLVGLFFTLLAAEEIVGALALKVLTSGNALLVGAGTTANFVQPLDILIVQANTNTLLSHFLSLATSLYLADRTRWLQQQHSTASAGNQNGPSNNRPNNSS